MSNNVHFLVDPLAVFDTFFVCSRFHVFFFTSKRAQTKKKGSLSGKAHVSTMSPHLPQGPLRPEKSGPKRCSFPSFGGRPKGSDLPSHPVVTSHWSGPSNQAHCDLHVHHPTCVSVLGLFPERASKLQEWQILSCRQEHGPEHEGDDPNKTQCLGQASIKLYKIVSRISQLIQQLLDNLPRDLPSSGFPSCEYFIAWFSTCPLCQRATAGTRSKRDATSFGDIEEFLADPCTMRINSETLRRQQPNEANRARKFYHSVCDGSFGIK